MTAFQISVQINKKQHRLTPGKMALYQQLKIVEAHDKHDFYYLFFHKNNFLTALKQNHLKINSSLHRAFTKGIIFDSTHPVIQTIFQQHNHFISHSLKQVLHKLKQTKPLTEIIHIFTILDSFIDLEQLHDLLKDFYYTYRRNGQNQAAAQLLHVYLQYDPADIFARDMLHELTQFQQQTTNNSDPVHMEINYFNQLAQPVNIEQLIQLYKQQNRLTDELIMRIYLMKQQPSSENLTQIQVLIKSYSESDQFYILKSIENDTPSKVIGHILINYLLQTEDHHEIVRYFIEHSKSIDTEQLPVFTASIKNAEQATFLSLFDTAASGIINLFRDNPKQMDTICTYFASAFLRVYSLEDILEWFKPFKREHVYLPIEHKVKTLQTLENDPDQQFLLGKLYLEFQQNDKAIECFKWEMELRPESPEPIKWLSKVYKQAGNKKEAAVYQQLWIQMEKTNAG